MPFFDWYAIAKELSGEDPLFILLPLILLLFWLIALFTYRYAALLFWSVLLVIFTLPHMISLVAFLLGRPGMFGLRFFSFTLLEGVVCFFVGILAIPESIARSRRY
jgi:hypothetical protein